MAYTDELALSQDTVFQQRVQMAVELSATEISSEVNTTTNHANRIALAKAVLDNPGQYTNAFSEAVCTNAAITAQSSDSDIQFTVNTVWDAIAGEGS